MTMSVLVMQAMHYARAAHIHQYRSDGKTPYLEHCRAVALFVEFGGGSEEAVAAALLHDVMEDCGVDFDGLAERFGDKVASLVSELTLVDGVPDRKQVQLRWVPLLSPDAKLIKLADILANLQDIPKASWSAQRKEKYYLHLQKMRDALAGTNPQLEAQFDHWSPIIGRELVPHGVAEPVSLFVFP